MALPLKQKPINASQGTSPPTTPQSSQSSNKLISKLDFSQKAHVSMFYGDSRTLKSWEWLEIAKYILKTTGKITRLVYADLGGFDAVREATEAGLVQLVKLADTASPNAALMKLTKGYWPVEHEGEVSEVWPDFTNNGGEEIGLYVFDSFSSLASMAMTELIDKRQRVGQDVVGAYDFFEEKFGNPSLAHYGSVQWTLRKLLANIANLPVPRVIVTALDGVGKDEAGRTVYGPQAIGKALTDSLPAMTGDLWRFELTKEGKYKAWFKHHPDSQTGVMWPANLRLSYGLEEWFKKYPKGYMEHGVFAGRSLVEYLEFYKEHSGKKAVEDMKNMVEMYKGKVIGDK